MAKQGNNMRYRVSRTIAGNGEYFDPDVKPWPAKVVQLADENGQPIANHYYVAINHNLVWIQKGTLIISDALGNVLTAILPGPMDPLLKIVREIEDQVWEDVEIRR